MLVHDFYTGFEGYDEIVIIERNNQDSLTKIRIWGGYFDELMQHIVESQKPLHTHGIATIWNTSAGGWYENNPWTAPDIKPIIEEFSSVDISRFSEPVKQLFAILTDTVTSALSKDNSIQISIE